MDETEHGIAPAGNSARVADINDWMHNNLRMYWGKRIIAMTPSPEAAWATACYLNDRLSLDGRDLSTYGNIAAMFGGSPSNHEQPIYGRVSTRGDGSTRRRDGGDEWLATQASRPVLRVSIPAEVPVDPYLTGDPTVGTVETPAFWTKKRT